MEKQTCIKTLQTAYIGMCVLELGKVLMYEIHYDQIKLINKINMKKN